MLQDVIGCLRCPVCRGELAVAETTLRCERRHSFDIARQGYVNLLTGGVRAGTADTAAMVRAREAFLAAGHLRPLADLLADRAAGHLAGHLAGRELGGCLLDVGAGTGYYLAAALDRSPDRAGLALDVSKHAAARAGRAHRRIGAVVCDVWRPLPVRDGAVSVILNVCAPRNGPEFRRVLRPGGVLLAVTPAASHLAELIEPLGLLSVDARKQRRVGGALDAHFEAAGRTAYRTRLRLGRDDAETLALMGPSAHHLDADTVRDRVASLPEPVEVTVSFDVTAYLPRTASSGVGARARESRLE